ncbi:unnamed protein product [Calypogeia fissa]
MTAPNLQKRYQRYEAKYKEAKNLSTSTGAGLTEEELGLGISLEDKLNKVCPDFDQMHLLLGGRPNVNPIGTADFGIDDDEFITHDDTNDEEDQSASPSLPASSTMILIVFSVCCQPIFAEVAVSIDLHPLFLMIPSVFASNYALILPSCTPPNAIALGTAYVSVIDMTTPGLLMHVLGFLLLGILTSTLDDWVFGRLLT